MAKSNMPMISQLVKIRLVGKNYGSFAVGATIFKIEDYKQTEHGSAFSIWKHLIGSNDWEDFKNGKEGVSRYRNQNLPTESCQGLYELGVSVISQDQGRKIDPQNVLTAYLGQSERVRSRLQEYGRSGAHLPTRFFEDIFSKGGSILYRWAQMRNKRETQATEAKILWIYDYAWNTFCNGERRHLELVKKLGDGEFICHRKLSCEVDTQQFFRSRPQPYRF
ncbi:unnamed protein product [Thlaspi arvense]|uniref:Uncharacterized protein n=1 Tax=Thlaspi arvense TaxID=13288 RepID=A0AAU9SR46_THLAR|nr:unnamed protein product [Thlaspi arvense]